MEITLSVILVNYNGSRFLKGCLDALYEKLGALQAEVILIDNHSTDDSCALIKTAYPQVKLIESKTNHGFGKGNNEAVKLARGQYLLLLNVDTILLDPLAPVLDFLEKDDTIGAVGINMRDAQGEYLPPAGNFPNVRNMFRLKNLFDLGPEFESGHFSRPSYEVDWLGGSFLMLPAKLYREIGGFDPEYFMYVEDVDLCKRITDKGYRCVFLPHFSYIHFVGFTLAKNPMLIRGYEIYIGKHFKGLQRIFISAALGLNKWVKKCKGTLKS